MKLFVPSSGKFDTFALFPEEGREYLIDIDIRPQYDDETNGSSLPYTPILKNGPLIVNPEFRSKGKAYKIIFNTGNIPDIWCGINEQIAILQDVSGHTFHFITVEGLMEIMLSNETTIINVLCKYSNKKYTFKCDNSEIEIEELK